MIRVPIPLEQDAAPIIRCGDKYLNLTTPKIMGILNLTPDSFYDGGQFTSKDLALKRIAQMLKEGADIIDIGAESSRPYAQKISLQEEIDRLMDILVAVKSQFDTLISVDTYKPQIMKEAIKLGANFINDIYALREPGALDVVGQSNIAICLMHMQNRPTNMQDNPQYKHVVWEIKNFLAERLKSCFESGVAKDRIIIDPGFGFGKTTQHNMQLLKNLTLLKELGLPILAGLSRKASIGELLSLPVEDRLYGSISAHVIAFMKGASIIRTHDIKPTAEALKIAQAVLSQEALEWS